MSQKLTLEQARGLATRALIASGAAPAPARSVARAALAAEACGRRNVGLAHLPYYCEALRRGAIDGQNEPDIAQPRPGLLTADARSGFTHYAFDQALDTFTTMAKLQGVAVLTIRNTYTCGALGYFPERLAERGLAGLAATNAGPAAVAPSGASQPLLSTNPLAFAVPRAGEAPLLIDQSTSACTLVDVRAARERGAPIPDGWALDAAGQPTTDPDAALAGSLQAFGGYRGANLALLVELLAAGLSGGNWSADAPSFADAPDCPNVGQWFLAMDLAAVPDAARRIDDYLTRLASFGTHVPGQHRAAYTRAATRDGIEVGDQLLARIRLLSRPA